MVLVGAYKVWGELQRSSPSAGPPGQLQDLQEHLQDVQEQSLLRGSQRVYVVGFKDVLRSYFRKELLLKGAFWNINIGFHCIYLVLGCSSTGTL